MFSIALINPAFAADPAVGAQAASASPFSFLILMAGFFAIVYFMILRPQNKRIKAQRELLGQLKPNDEVLTASGIVGRVVKLEDSFVHVKIGESTVVMIQAASVVSALPKGTFTLASWL